MKKRLLALILALVMCVGLTIPAMAYDFDNGKCTYELSNDIIGTVELLYPNYETNELEAITVYVVPDNTTVIPKNAPGARMVSSNYIFGDWVAGGPIYEAGEPLVVEPSLFKPSLGEDIEDSWLAYAVWTEDTSAEGYDPSPDAMPVGYLDMDEEKEGNGAFRVISESAAKGLGLAIQPYTPGTAPTTQFSDVKTGDWFYDAVNWAVEKEITNGTGDGFSPDADCTHDHILTFLWRAAGKPESAAALPFTPKNDWAAGALAWAYEKGMIGADLDEDAACTSADAVVYIWQAKDKPAAAYDGRFTDVAQDAAYAPAVAWAVDAKVTVGDSATTFGPSTVCSRARIVTFLQRAFQ